MTDQHLKLAVIIPGDTEVNLSKEVLRGIAQSQQEINDDGGVNGKKIAYQITIDRDDPAQGQPVAHALVNNVDILGVVGHVSSGVTLSVAKTYDQGKLVAISPISSAVKLSNQSPYIFRTIPSDAVAGKALARYSLQQNHDQAIVFFNSQSDYSQSLKSEFIANLTKGNGRVIAEVDLSASNFSAPQALQRAAQQGADHILLAANTSTLDRALQVVTANAKKLPIVGGDDLYSSKTLDVSREQSKGMVLAVPWHILANTRSTFPERAQKLWKADVGWRTVTSYDASQALIAGLKRSPTREGLQQTLRNPNFSALGAEQLITFLPSGDRNGGIQLVTIAPGNRSSFGVDFIPLPNYVMPLSDYLMPLPD